VAFRGSARGPSITAMIYQSRHRPASRGRTPSAMMQAPTPPAATDAAIILPALGLPYPASLARRTAFLRLDSAATALRAAMALLASGQMTLDDFGSAVDMPTVALLFAMMIISAQFAESGFIDLCARTITSWGGGTAGLLAITVAIGGALSAVLANDILI